MKKFLLLIIAISSFAFTQGQKLVHSGKSNIRIIVNGRTIDWSISPETNPDRLKVYCSKEKNEVIFQTDIDTAYFSVKKNDTIKFIILLKSKDSARTEIIGIKDLPAQITNNEKVYWLSQIWSETKYNFVNIDKLPFDLDSMYRSYIPLVLASRNDFEYYRLLKKFMASLHDGHSEVSDNQFYPYMDYTPVSLQDFNKKVYITMVRKVPGLDSTWVGAEVTEVDNIGTTQYLETRVFPYISA